MKRLYICLLFLFPFAPLHAQNCMGMPAHATAIATASGGGFFCEQQPFQLSASGHSTGTGISYQWQSSPVGAFSFSDVPSAWQPVHIVNSAAQPLDYRMITKCLFSGLADTSSIVTVQVMPLPEITHITETHSGLSYTFTAHGLQHSQYLTWYYGEGYAAGLNGMYTYSATGTYTVMAIPENECGQDTAYLTIQATTAVNDIGNFAAQITVHPNPATDYIVVTTAGIRVKEIKMTTAAGQTIKKIITPQGNGSYRISTAHLPAGIYYLHLLTDKGMVMKTVSVVR